MGVRLIEDGYQQAHICCQLHRNVKLDLKSIEVSRNRRQECVHRHYSSARGDGWQTTLRPSRLRLSSHAEAINMNAYPLTDAPLQSPWLRLARWLVLVYALVMFARVVVGLALYPHYAQTHLNVDAINAPNSSWTAVQAAAALAELGWPATTMAWVQLATGLFTLPVAYLVLFLLLWRGATNWFRVYVAFVCASIGGLGETFAPIVELAPALAVVDDILGGIGWQLFFITFYFFPDGRVVPGWARWLAGLWGTLIVMEVVAHLARGTGLAGSPLITWLSTGLVFSAIGSQIYRYFWRADTAQRQQIKWVVFTLALILIVIGVVVFPFAFRPPNPERLGPDLIVAMIHLSIFRLSFALVFAAIGVAILRYRLFDIDIIIRKTLQYTVITALLSIIYFGSVFFLQRLFSNFTGQQSPLILVVSTLLIAALFAPLRRRIQDGIDRRFYRQRYDARQVVAQFARTARDETDMDALIAELERTIQETLQPEGVRVWMRKE